MDLTVAAPDRPPAPRTDGPFLLGDVHLTIPGEKTADQSKYYALRVERLDGEEPTAFPGDNTYYGREWKPQQVAVQVNLDTRIMHSYDGALRVHVGDEWFDFPAGMRAADQERHRRRMAIYKELRRHTKAELCRMAREGGLVWSAHPPEKWTKEEVMNHVIEQRLRSTDR